MSTVAAAPAFPALPPAPVPPETVPGRTRADVALLVAARADDRLTAARFCDLPGLLAPGDLLVVNTSATLAAALPARLDGMAVRVHLSTPLAPGRWVVELRTAGLGRFSGPPLGARLALPAGGALTLLRPYRGSARLTEATLAVPGGTLAYLARHGSPIRYPGHPRALPLAAYQTIFARDPGSAEMPSAARPFTPGLVAALRARGVRVARITLHAGVSSLDRDEAPYPERYRVPAAAARLVAATRERGGRVIAVGTTVVRALETAATGSGVVAADRGWTDLVVTPERGLSVVDGLISGWHEPASSHLLMLEALSGRPLLERAYARAAALGLAGHEFGDAHLMLP